MLSAAFVVPGRLDTPTGGSIYDKRIIEGLRARGWSIQVIELEGDFPAPSPGAALAANVALSSLQDNTIVIADGLVFGAIPDVVLVHKPRLRFVPIVHLPLALDIGLDDESARRLERSERQALMASSAVVVTGSSTRDVLAGYGVPRELIAVVPPGTDTAAIAHGSVVPIVEVLCVATLSPGKGHEILLRALAAAPVENWHLTCAGSLTRHPATVAAVQERMRTLGIEHQVVLTGELHGEALDAVYSRADVFALATLRETYGMAVAEALARGLPVVSTRTGAIPELVGSDAGLLAVPGDQESFTREIAAILGDVDLRRRLATGARVRRDHLPAWSTAVDAVAALLQRVHG
jgi:glycosyltransferase involved in cell wall biosynthesis